jgi:hypothetical protein
MMIWEALWPERQAAGLRRTTAEAAAQARSFSSSDEVKKTTGTNDGFLDDLPPPGTVFDTSISVGPLGSLETSSNNSNSGEMVAICPSRIQADGSP